MFSTSFLDLLSCGMGAVIILLIIFLSRLRIEPRDAAAFASVSFRVDYGDIPIVAHREVWTLDGKPLLAIRPSGDSAKPFEYTVGSAPTFVGLESEAVPRVGGASNLDGADVTSNFWRDPLDAPKLTFPGRASGGVVCRLTDHMPTGRRQTSISIRDWNSPRAVTYSVHRGLISASSAHHFDDNLNFVGGPAPNGRGWVSHTYAGREEVIYTLPTRVSVSIYTTNSAVSFNRDIYTYQFVKSPNGTFSISIILDPDAEPGTDPVKQVGWP
ncbi:hypothetical protein [Gemmata obscuriglobus]|uniref:hypothetical protein n=1 Tax=Gemmata obscuriglobus TaxID=114 RepID=UPI0011CEABC1|nr:hypothetical protein [Gemmata obscuriglobus]